MEQIRYNLLFRWFVRLAIEDTVWDHSVFAKNRDRLLENQVIEAFFTEVMTVADKAGLLSKEHFSVDGTLIQAWASQKSFRRKDGSDDQPPGGGGRNAQADWKGKPRRNNTRRGGSAIDTRTMRHRGYVLSQTIRKRIEEHFGWCKAVGGIHQALFRGLQRVDRQFKHTMTASNIMRMARILFAVPQGAQP